MARFYWLRKDAASTSRYTGHLNAVHHWGLPGVHCSTCGATWGGGADTYPSVDLSELPNRAEFEDSSPRSLEELARLCEEVRPLLPPGTPLHPGTRFGPLTGTAMGTFGPLSLQNSWTLLVHREALERLQEAGVQGLKGYPTALRFRQKRAPELLDLEIPLSGLLHTDCLPADREPSCGSCGRQGFSRPEEPLLDAASLPEHIDLFRLADWPPMIIGSQRFVEAVKRLELDGVAFRELPLR